MKIKSCWHRECIDVDNDEVIRGYLTGGFTIVFNSENFISWFQSDPHFFDIGWDKK